MTFPSNEALRSSEINRLPENTTNNRELSFTENKTDKVSQRTVKDHSPVNKEDLKSYQAVVLDSRRDLFPKDLFRLTPQQCSTLITGRYLPEDVEGLSDQRARALQNRRFDKNFNRAEVDGLSNLKVKVLSERKDLYRIDIEYLQDFQVKVLSHGSYAPNQVESLTENECLKLIYISSKTRSSIDSLKLIHTQKNPEKIEDQFRNLKVDYENYVLHLKKYSFKNYRNLTFQESADKKYEKLESFVTLYPDFQDRLPKKCTDF